MYIYISPRHPPTLDFSLLAPLPLLISGCLLTFPFEVPTSLKYISGVIERQSEKQVMQLPPHYPDACLCIELHSVAVRL